MKGTSTSEERTDIQGDAALSSQGGATPPRQGSDNQQQQDSEPLIKKAAYVDRLANSDLLMNDASRNL